MDTGAYLERIGYKGPRMPTADTLRRLQVAHLLAVPFENLSIHAHEPIVLDDDALFDKVVTRRRGGFCYELNGLFCHLLRTLGFDVTMLAAEVMNARDEYGLPFDHMTLRVRLAEEWLVDVGFGDSFLEPLRLVPALVQTQGDRGYRIDEENERFFVRQRIGSASWRTQYRFTLQPYQYADYVEMCRYHQTSPDSHFTRGRICTIAVPDGRVTLTDTRLITTRAGRKEERSLAREQEYAEELLKNFGIVMSR